MKYDRIVEISKARTMKCEQICKETIKKMIDNGEKVNLYQVEKKTGVSKSFLYHNEEISKLIKSMR